MPLYRPKVDGLSLGDCDTNQWGYRSHSIMPWCQAQSMEKKNQKIHTVQPSSILMPHEIWQFPPASLVSCPVALIKGMLLSLDSRPAPVSFPRVRSGYKYLSWPCISRYTVMKIKKYNIGLCCQCVLFPKCLLSFSFIGTFSPHFQGAMSGYQRKESEGWMSHSFWTDISVSRDEEHLGKIVTFNFYIYKSNTCVS